MADADARTGCETHSSKATHQVAAAGPFWFIWPEYPGNQSKKSIRERFAVGEACITVLKVMTGESEQDILVEALFNGVELRFFVRIEPAPVLFQRGVSYLESLLERFSTRDCATDLDTCLHVC